jgi:hypothetical protein
MYTAWSLTAASAAPGWVVFSWAGHKNRLCPPVGATCAWIVWRPTIAAHVLRASRLS